MFLFRIMVFFVFFFFKQKTAYDITYGYWSSDVCSSDLLLDHAIAEFAFGQVAPDQKLDGAGGRKLLLRQLAKKRLPAWFDAHRKQGFTIPLNAWLKGPWASVLQDLAAGADEGLL